MRMIALLNKEIPFGKALNALAHISIGMGHRLDGAPGVEVLFAPNDVVASFREQTAAINATSKDTTVQADFTDTMTVDTAVEQLERTKARAAKDLTYYAAAFVSTSVEHRQALADVLSSCKVLGGYKPFPEQAGELLPVKAVPAFDPAKDQAPDNKISMIINKKVVMTKTGVTDPRFVNSVVLSCLELGAKAALDQLTLLNFVDFDGNSHLNISYHPFPILASKSNNKHQAMEKVMASSELPSAHQPAAGDNLVSVCFGVKEAVEALTDRKNTSIFNAELDSSWLKPVAELEASAPAEGSLASSSTLLAERVAPDAEQSSAPANVPS